MDELKVLVEMVANLPQMALWVAAGFWAYKVIVIGSVYGLIRFTVLHIYRMYTAEKMTNATHRIGDMVITAQLNNLLAQLKRVATYNYIHSAEVEWLKQAIDDKMEKDAEEKRSSNKERYTLK